MLERRPLNPGIEGAALGLLYGIDGNSGERIKTAAEGYMQGTEEARRGSAAFLRGLFFTARDYVFASGDFLELIDGLLGRLSTEEFLKLLPELRLAFSYFTPMETDRIAARAAAFHGKKGQDILRGRAVSPEEYAYGETLDHYIREQMKGADL